MNRQGAAFLALLQCSCNYHLDGTFKLQLFSIIGKKKTWQGDEDELDCLADQQAAETDKLYHIKGTE